MTSRSLPFLFALSLASCASMEQASERLAVERAVLDYVEATAAHHGTGAASLREAAAATSALWQEHEHQLAAPVLDFLARHDGVRLIGPTESADPSLHPCPTIAFVPRAKTSAEVAAELVARGVMCGNGDFYARRLLEGVDVDLTHGVVRVSWVHYTNQADIDRLLTALAEVLS